MSSKKDRKKRTPEAERVDRYELYLQAVQAPEHEIPIFDRAYRKHFGKPPRVLREDFCGTFAVCCEWVKSRLDRVAVGVDLDPEPLAWGKVRHLSELRSDQQKRVSLLQDDVRSVNGSKADVVTAQNFSFFVFKTRDELLTYFRAAYENLASKGVFVLDMMGGHESMEEDREDVTEFKGFDYVWDQVRFDPITHDCTFHIHFRFKDGSEMNRAFSYKWRFWMLPEVRELLEEAGFSRVDIYWEGTDPKTGEGNDVFRIRRQAPGDPAWICYVVAVK